MPTVSVIIPTYNAEKFLTRTIESVLAQTYEDFELLLADDRSSDNTAEIIKNYEKHNAKIKGIFLTENSGSPGHPNNVALNVSKGKYIAFLAHDDEWLPTKLEKQMAIFEAKNDIDFVGCYTIVVKSSQKKIEKNNWPENYLERMLTENIVPYPSSIVVRRSTLDKIGGIDERLKTMDDWDLWIRAVSLGCKFAFVNESLLKYFLHGENLSKQKNYTQARNDYRLFYEKHKKLFTKYPRIHSIQLRKLASLYCASGDIRAGRKLYVESIAKNIFNTKTYFYLLISFLGSDIFKNFYTYRKNLN